MVKIMEGVFAVNKPTGISSAQALRDLQHHFNPSTLFSSWIESEKNLRGRENHNQRKRRKEKIVQVKIGHGGTLDPLATGVLIAGVGKGTKSLQDFLTCTKTYEAVMLFGTSTDTYDRVGKVLRRAPYEHITKEMVEEKLQQFRGKFMQLPPLFSALKMNGKPLYEYAREGKEIPREIERRPVEVLNLEIVEWMEGGTHEHKAPTDEAGYAEVNVANKFWKKENVLPASQTEAGSNIKQDEVVSSIAKAAEGSEPMVKEQLESTDPQQIFEQNKRKMGSDQDDLVLERPASKRGKATTTSSSVDATMSGGLPAPATPSTSTPEIKTEESSFVKGPPAARLRMTVTSGFYVRSLCHDLGAAVGSAGIMAELERTRQGEFELGRNVLDWADLEKGEEVWGPKVAGWLDEWNGKGRDPVDNVKVENAEDVGKAEGGEVAAKSDDVTLKSENVADEAKAKVEEPETTEKA